MQLDTYSRNQLCSTRFCVAVPDHLELNGSMLQPLAGCVDV